MTKRTCKSAWSFGGNFSDDGYFEMACPNGGEVKVYLPFSTKFVNVKKFSYYRYIKGYQEKFFKTFNYTGGKIKIDVPNAYALVARCGSEEKIFVNVMHNKTIEKERNAIMKKRESKEKEVPPNILVLFLDTVSRKQFVQDLKKTSAFISSVIRDKNYTHEAFQFLRYHSVWSLTRPNFCQMIHTKTKSGLHSIWEAAKEFGYVTMVENDICELFATWSLFYIFI